MHLFVFDRKNNLSKHSLLDDCLVKTMGWKSDWLYRLVFNYLELAWTTAQRDGESRFGPAPTLLRVTEFFADNDGQQFPSLCQPRRCWVYNGLEWRAEKMPEPYPVNSVVGMFYIEARGGFFISADRKMVVIEYRFGPRYGRGGVFVVQGQGTRASLLPEQDSIGWVS
jgi:hypothetical protein